MHADGRTCIGKYETEVFITLVETTLKATHTAHFPSLILMDIFQTYVCTALAARCLFANLDRHLTLRSLQ